MNNKISVLNQILVISTLLLSCQVREVRESKNDESASLVSLSHNTSEKYIVDKKESVVTWKGSMLLTPANAHTGYVYISRGELMVEGSKPVGGTVEVDMNTLADKEHGGENDLINHLKSDDFFDVKKFPVAAFFITNVVPMDGSTINVTGNLTIKGITHPVTFPAKTEVKNGIVTAIGKLSIDRTIWDIRYKSGKFFANLADEAISDYIELEMKIIAKK